MPAAWIRYIAAALLVGCSGPSAPAEGLVAHVLSEGASGDCTDAGDHGASETTAAPPDCNAEVQQHCWLARSEAGLLERPLAVHAGAFTAAVSVVPAADQSSAVIGISAGPAASVDDLPIAVRFTPEGTIDARNGESFASLAPRTPLAYAKGSAYRLFFVVDTVGRAYSVWVNGRLVGRNFAFHGVPGTTLDRFATWVSAETRVVRVCDFGSSESDELLWLRHSEEDEAAVGGRTLAGLAGGELLITSPAVTKLVDSRGNVVETFPRGGRGILLDAEENRYLFGEFSGAYDGGGERFTSAGGTDVYVSKYDRSFRQLYTRVLGGTGDDELSAFDLNATGSFVVLVGGTVSRFDDAGRLVWTRSTVDSQAALALDDAGRTYLAENGGASAGFTLTAIAADNSTLWTRSGSMTAGGSASVLALRGTPDGGIVASGALFGGLELGGTMLSGSSNDGDATFVAWFDGAGTYRGGAVLDLVPNGGLAIDDTNAVTLGGYRESRDAFVLERLRFDGDVVDRVELGGHELLRGLFHGTATVPSVNHGGDAYWFVTPRMASQDSASFLLKLRPSP